jgi:hypothetical protein
VTFGLSGYVIRLVSNIAPSRCDSWTAKFLARTFSNEIRMTILNGFSTVAVLYVVRKPNPPGALKRVFRLEEKSQRSVVVMK